MLMGENFNCSTFRFNQSNSNERHRDMDGGSNYRWFCIHVRNVVGAVCGLELFLLAWMIMYNKYPLIVCQTVNVTSSFKEAASIRPVKLTFHEQKACSTYSLLICFTIFHVICDLITLLAILIKKHNLVLPLLILLVLNIVVSCQFLINALIAYAFSNAKYDMYFISFILAQTFIRIYEFVCARRLYWYFQWAADERYMPQSSLLKNEESSPFQF